MFIKSMTLGGTVSHSLPCLTPVEMIHLSGGGGDINAGNCIRWLNYIWLEWGDAKVTITWGWHCGAIG